MYKTVDSFRPHFEALARVGYFNIGLDAFKPVPRRRFLHKCFMILVWLLIVAYNLQHIIRVVQARHSIDQMVDTLFILLTTLNTLGKQIAFNVRARRILRVMTIINGQLWFVFLELTQTPFENRHLICFVINPVGKFFAARNNFHETVLKANAVAMSRLLAVYHGAIFICTGLWTIYPLVNKVSGYAVEFTGYFPFNTKESPGFEFAVAYMSVLILVQAYGNVTMDCTIVAFFAQAKTQLQIVRFDLEHFNDFDLVSKQNGREVIVKQCNLYIDLVKTRKRILKNRLVRSIKHYEQITWFVKEVEAIFGEAMVVQFMVMAWVICMTVYKIIGLSLLSAEFVSMAMYLGCMLAQLFIYCYYGTQLQFESEFLIDSIFNANWLSLSPQFRSNLLILMERCHRPIVPRTAYVIPMSLNTYIAVLRSSYTLFTFLERK